MKFQQGVFMLLTDFQLFNDTYFTKNIRDSFEINKYIIDKEICPVLVIWLKVKHLGILTKILWILNQLLKAPFIKNKMKSSKIDPFG